MKTLNGWLQVIMNTLMFTDQTITPRTMWWSRKLTIVLYRTSGVGTFSTASRLNIYFRLRKVMVLPDNTAMGDGDYVDSEGEDYVFSEGDENDGELR